MSKKSKYSKKSSVPFTVSLKSPKHKDTVANLQVQKRLDSLLKKRGKFGQSQQEGGFIGAILATTGNVIDLKTILPATKMKMTQILHQDHQCFLTNIS